MTLVVGLLTLVAMAVPPARPVGAATLFVVNDAGDGSDFAVNGVCETATGNGICTLRAALQEAAGLSGSVLIEFHITSGAPGSLREITVLGDLPGIDANVTLDGWSQGVFDGTANYAGPPLIQVKKGGGATFGLTITAGSTIIKGLSITGFDAFGIYIAATSGPHTIVGCYIGVVPNLGVPDGTSPSGNGIGIFIDGTPDVTIGGTGTGEGNVIAANNGGAPGFGLGIFADTTADLKLQANVIGTDRRNTTGLGNVGGGVLLRSTDSAVVGTGTAAGRNIISGNGTSFGLRLESNADSSVIHGNYIGVGSDGSTRLANLNGIEVESSSDIQIGGVGLAEGNVISGNITSQVSLTGLCACVDFTRLRGNIIGLNAAGTAIVTNTAYGVLITDAQGIVVGGNKTAEGNIISGNQKDGIALIGDGTQDVLIYGNRIGTNVTGTAALGNGRDGISVSQIDPAHDGPASTGIGTEDAGSGNLISGNGRHGINMLGAVGDTTVYYNSIGTDKTGLNPIPNQGDGILLENSNGVFIQQNTIAFNGVSGIVNNVGAFYSPIGNGIIANSIFGNTRLGIDVSLLVNVDGSGDGVSPANTVGILNAPVVTAATTSGAGTSIGGTLSAGNGLKYRIELYASPSCDTPGGSGEGRSYIGTTELSTNGSGQGSFVANVGPIAPGQVITATASLETFAAAASLSDLIVDTSEFSVCKSVTSAAILVTPTSGLTTTEAGGTATFTVALATEPTAQVTIGLSSNKPGEATVSPPTLTFQPGSGTTPQTVTVTGVPDAVADGNQVFTIVTAPASSTDPAYNNLDAPDVQGVNQDSTALPSLTIDAAQVTEGTGTNPAMTFNVHLAPASTQTVTVNWIVESGTASVNTDIVGTDISGGVTFAPGETLKTISIHVIGDNVVEGNETFTVRLQNAQNAALGTATATGTILDDDSPTGACSPRPKITMTIARTGTDQLLVTVKAGQGSLQSIQFGSQAAPMQNAVVETISPNSTITGNGTFTVPTGVTQQAFIVRRVVSGQPVHVPLVVTDGCGAWPTFVGAGNAAF
ncbi:MAG: Calx-beta domain-containing protein [Chloroflexota bacterium]